MVRLQGGRPVGRERFRASPEAQEQDFVESQVNGGMVTMVDAADLPNKAMQVVKNATIRFDRTSRRPGTILLTPVKPNSLPVLKLAFIKKKNGAGHTIRMTHDSIHTRGVGVWNAIAGSLAGTVKDRFQTAVVLDDFVFSNNGADEIQRIDFTGATFADLGNAPKYRYVTGIANRVVGAALRGVDETQVGWSGDANIDEWDPGVDETAGFSPIIYSTDDLSDYITGIFTTDNLILLREKSIWVGFVQAIPQDPFYFRPVPGVTVGCDCPYSAQMTSDGLAWLDRRTQTVYLWPFSGMPQPIGRPIEKNILQNVNDPNEIFAAFNPIRNEYSICIPQVGSNYVNVWTWNGRTKTWAWNEYYALTSMDDTDLATAGLTIDQLGSVPIDDLIGTIDDLSPDNDIIPTRATGRADGDIGLDDINTDIDIPHADFPGGFAYQTNLTSKAFDLPTSDMSFSSLVIEYISHRGGTFEIEYSKNGGQTEASWRHAKTVTVTDLGIPKLMKFKKNIRTRRIAWRIRTTSGLFDVLKYWVRVIPSQDLKVLK
jgi:hypothetical protein